MPSLFMNSVNEFPNTNHGRLRFDRFGRDPRHQQAGQAAKGQFVSAARDYVKRVGSVGPFVLKPGAGVAAGQTAQGHHPRLKTEIGVRFAGRDKLVHLIGLGEVVARLGRSFAERFHRTAQIGQGFTDRNQAVSFTRHALFSHVPQTRQGHYRRLFPIRHLRDRHHRKRGEDAVAGVHFQGHSDIGIKL